MFGSRSEEVTTVGFLTKVFSCRKEVTFDAVVCLIEVDGVHSDIGLLKPTQRVVGSEDQFVTASINNPVNNLLMFGSRKVMSFTTVNVHYTRIGNKL